MVVEAACKASNAYMVKNILRTTKAGRLAGKSIHNVITTPGINRVASAVGKIACCSVKGFIFTAGPGRSGTTSLARIFARVKRCAAYHEPSPRMNGMVLARYNDGDELFMRKFFKLKKLPVVYLKAAFRQWYVESNSQFIKCFSEAAADEFKNRLQVIHLIRDRHEVARSILARGNIPGTPEGNFWKQDYHAPRNIIKMAPVLDKDPRYAHDYFKCLWYWYETHARVEAFKKRYPSVPVHRIWTEELNDLDAVYALMMNIGIDVEKDHVSDIIGIRANKSRSVPVHPAGVDLDALMRFDNLCSDYLDDPSCLKK